MTCIKEQIRDRLQITVDVIKGLINLVPQCVRSSKMVCCWVDLEPDNTLLRWYVNVCFHQGQTFVRIVSM